MGPRSLSDKQIAGCFNSTLGLRYRVRLIGGAHEPLYQPGDPDWALIRYKLDYPASALHELAHWCIAGHARRKQVDYGYWYDPPPRTESAQVRFAAVELPVQALESILARACERPFQVSVDDVDGSPEFAAVFSAQVAVHARQMELVGRAEALRANLQRLSMPA